METEFGFHIIKVEDKKEGGASPLKEVEPLIKQALAGDKAKGLAREALMALSTRSSHRRRPRRI